MAVDVEVSPFLRVTVDSVVTTQDGQKLGKVKEVESHHFKVGTSFLQRDYWLAEDTVDSAVPSDTVTLNLDSNQVAEHKILKDPEA